MENSLSSLGINTEKGLPLKDAEPSKQPAWMHQGCLPFF
jgi:hypothetical protein